MLKNSDDEARFGLYVLNKMNTISAPLDMVREKEDQTPLNIQEISRTFQL